MLRRNLSKTVVFPFVSRKIQFLIDNLFMSILSVEKFSSMLEAEMFKARGMLNRNFESPRHPTRGVATEMKRLLPSNGGSGPKSVRVCVLTEGNTMSRYTSRFVEVSTSTEVKQRSVPSHQLI